MQIFKEKDMIKGWFVGDFQPSCLNTQNLEVALKRYKAGEKESAHYHKVATEITFIVSGMVTMNNITYSDGDIVVIEPGESTDFYAIEDTITTVVKIPSVKNDKYETNNDTDIS